jgi:inner membrane protease subunit 1
MMSRRRVVRGVGMFVAAYVASYTAVASLKRISGSSMQPTLNATGDWVLVNNFVLRLRRGDVVIAKSPNGDLVCKRVVALPGDVVALPPSLVATTAPSPDRVDGLLPPDFFSLVVAAAPPPTTTTLSVPDQHVWLEGDNPLSSFDSRQYGPVPMRSVRGRVVARVWPLSQAGFIAHGNAPPR